MHRLVEQIATLSRKPILVGESRNSMTQIKR
jgi:hypothetical protein